eukprot:jgi/Mesvir1/7128/Mv09230-RA.1
MSKRKGEDTDDGDRQAPRLTGGKDSAHQTQRQGMFLLNVRALNTQFHQWVNAQAKDNQDALWSEGVQDYIRHTQRLQSEFADVIDQDKKPSSSAAAAAKPDASSNGTLPTSSPSSSAADKTGADGGSTAGGASASGNGWQFPAASFKTNPFGGGMSPAVGSGAVGASAASGGDKASFQPSSATSSAPLFGSASKPLNSVASPISPFGAPLAGVGAGGAPFGGGSGGAEGEEDGEEEPPQPGSPSLKAAQTDDESIVFSATSKLYKMENNENKDYGVGNCSVRVRKGENGEKGSAHLVFRNEGGAVLLNAGLFATMTCTVTKNLVTTFLVNSVPAPKPKGGPPGDAPGSPPADPAAAAPKPAIYRFKFGKVESCEELVKAINEHKPAAK